MTLTIERVHQIWGDASFCVHAVPAFADRPGSFVFKLTANELTELCRAWLELETRVKCAEADRDER